jgi:hypothetical protein
MIIIKEPIWKTRSIGVDIERRNEPVQISFRKVDGSLLYPHTYKIPDKNYPIKWKKGGHDLIDVPINDLEVIC